MTFLPAGAGATDVQVDLEYDAPGGKLGAVVAKLFGEEPGQQIEEDLKRFKRILESHDAEKPVSRMTDPLVNGKGEWPGATILPTSRSDQVS